MITNSMPELARKPATTALTKLVHAGSTRSYWTVESIVAMLEDGLGRMTMGDLERIIKLGDDAYLVLKEQKDGQVHHRTP